MHDCPNCQKLQAELTALRGRLAVAEARQAAADNLTPADRQIMANVERLRARERYDKNRWNAGRVIEEAF